VHHLVDRQVQLRRLLDELPRGLDIAEGANRVRAAGGNDVRALATRPQCLRKILHDLTDVRPAGADRDLRAEQSVEQHVAALVEVRVVGFQAPLQDDVAAKPEFGRDRRGLPDMVRLRGALRDDGRRPLAERLGEEVFELARLVAASGKAGAVVALDPYARAAEIFAEPVERLERRRQVRHGDARKA
jgi:hypothetical protein